MPPKRVPCQCSLCRMMPPCVAINTLKTKATRRIMPQRVALCLVGLARQERIELSTACLEGTCSIQLSYWRKSYFHHMPHLLRESVLYGEYPCRAIRLAWNCRQRAQNNDRAKIGEIALAVNDCLSSGPGQSNENYAPPTGRRLQTYCPRSGINRQKACRWN